MKRFNLLIAFFLTTTLLSAQKQVAITIDDLPLNGGGGKISLTEMIRINYHVIETCVKYAVPAIGFVNEVKLIKPGEMDARTGILKSWLDAGLELGNHTFSHPSFYKTTVEEFEEEVIKGEVITRALVTSQNAELRYFRHPFLNTGADSLSKVRFEKFLKDHGYEIAPVTVESADYIYNKIYTEAMLSGDSSTMQETGEAYVDHSVIMFEFAEKTAQEITGRSVPQIFLCHVNALNAAFLDDVLEKLEERGYDFVSLGDALEDPVYEQSDNYIGPWGISWLYRWTDDPKGWLMKEPEVPKDILDRYRN